MCDLVHGGVFVRVFHGSFMLVCGQAAPVVSGGASGGPTAPAAAVCQCVCVHACVHVCVRACVYVCVCETERRGLDCALCGACVFVYSDGLGLASESCLAEALSFVAVPFATLPVRLFDQL